ncbi:XRE family transcriptional regulator [Vibrio sp. SCSIO 43140]|uniref:XRE family transcriptional regulator n=1 Tax=Vibrio sp. SCSIO 43140 TaxID=2819100 RepID=UPI0020759F4B|nr:XRE family transcriptional regulator [Vibrio sp. SCSIO 43140]USD61320.1 XRE family transcriptional regulator [Vibrio sp. SCSIO 43140]
MIALLQNKYYEEFCGLDAITLSRWINGRSRPAFYKQLLIAKVLGKNPIDFILVVGNHEKYSKKSLIIVDALIKSLDLSLSVLSYQNVPDKIVSEIVTHNNQEHSRYFEQFYSNVSALKQFRVELLNLENRKHHTILLKNQRGTVVGHWSTILDFQSDDFSSLPKTIKLEEDRACIVQLGYFMNSEHFFELVVQASCYYLEKLWKNKEVVYIFVAGKFVVDFCVLVFGAEIVQYYRPRRKEDKLGVYLIRFNIVKAISNQVILPKIKNKLECVINCKNCGLCNLNKFM